MVGVGEILGSFTMSQIVDRLSNRRGVIFNVFLIFVVWIVSAVMISRNKHDAFTYLFTFSWGFLDGSVATHCG